MKIDKNKLAKAAICRACRYCDAVTDECTIEEDVPEEELKDFVYGQENCQYYERDSIRKYAEKHLKYIKENEDTFYQDMLLEGNLNEYLIDLDKRARKELDNLVNQAMKNDSKCPEQGTLEYAQYLNNLTASMEEIIYRDYVYTLDN